MARGRDVVARWCDLAEQRLEYLTELFETGRWRRFHSERAFLENIQEAKKAVETWRDLLTRETSRNNSAIDMSWVGKVTLPRTEAPRHQVDRLPLQPAEIRAAPASHGVPIIAKAAHISSDEAPSAPETPVLDIALEPVLEISAIAERYPLLRNAL